jgi:hypothetical protein
VFALALLLLLPTSGVAANLTSVSLKPTTVVQGTPSVGTATLDTPAPASGVFVTVISLDPAAVTVGGVTVPQGATSVKFVVDTVAVPTSTQVAIQSSCDSPCNGTQTATLTVTPRVPVRGVAGDLWADVIIGKPDFGEYTPAQVTNARMFNPGGAARRGAVSDLWPHFLAPRRGGRYARSHVAGVEQRCSLKGTNMEQGQLLAHCGSKKRCREDLTHIPTPAETLTHKPVPHHEVVEEPVSFELRMPI